MQPSENGTEKRYHPRLSAERFRVGDAVAGEIAPERLRRVGVEAPGDCACLVLGEASHAHPLGYPPRLAGARSRGARLDHRGRECPVTSPGKKLPLLTLGPLGAGVPTHVCSLRSPWPFLLLAPPCTPRRPPRSSPHRLFLRQLACQLLHVGRAVLELGRYPGSNLRREGRLWQTLHCGWDAFLLTPAFRYDRKCRRSEHRSLVPNVGTSTSRGGVLLTLN